MPLIGFHQEPLRIRQPCGPPPPVAMDAGGDAPAGRSIGDYSYHPGSPRTASGQASPAFDTAAAVEASVALHCSLR